MKKYIRHYLKIIILLFYIFLSKKLMIFPETFIFWVWIIYIANLFLTYYGSGFMNTALDITRIYLSSRSEEIHKKDQKMYSCLIPSYMNFVAAFWGAIHILSFAIILRYQGLVIGICSEILLFILITVLPIRFNTFLKIIKEYIERSDPKIKEYLAEAGFDVEYLKPVIKKAINEKINPNMWWLDIKKEK